MQSTIKSAEPIISNDFVTCYSDHLVVHSYYFPYGNKTIKYEDILSCELLQMRDLSILTCKHWGMALSSIWWHLDMRRFSREHYILLDVNKWPKIGLTMNDNDIIHVYELIKRNTSNDTTTTKEPFDYTGKVDTKGFNSAREKELEHQKSLENNKAKYM